MTEKTPFHETIIRGIVNQVIAPITGGMDKIGLYSHLWHFVCKQATIADITSTAFNNYQAQSHDIFVCTFSKSGTNWMLQITQQIAHKGKAEFEHIHDIVPWPDSGPIPAIIPLDDPTPLECSPTDLRIIKTHLPFQYAPYNSDAKYITVIRDPKDVFVSSYFFIKATLLDNMMPSVDTWLDLFLSPHFPMGDWSEHTASYWAQSDKLNMMLITFRKLRNNSDAYVRDIANFMTVSLTEEELAEVVKKSSFAHMKQMDSKFAPPFRPPWLKKRGQIIRQGKSGTSSELLSLEQQGAIDDYMQAELKRLGSDFPYTDYFDLA